MGELTLTQVRSAAKTSQKQRDSLRSLKLGRIGKSSTMEDTPQLRGAIAKVSHLITVAEGKGS